MFIPSVVLKLTMLSAVAETRTDAKIESICPPNNKIAYTRKLCEL